MRAGALTRDTGQSNARLHYLSLSQAATTAAQQHNCSFQNGSHKGCRTSGRDEQLCVPNVALGGRPNYKSLVQEWKQLTHHKRRRSTNLAKAALLRQGFLLECVNLKATELTDPTDART